MKDQLSDPNHFMEALPSTDNWQSDFEEAVRLHQRGIDGDTEAVKQAHSLLKKIRTAMADNSLVEAYFGSATTLLGRDELDPLERFKKVNKGLKIMDRAVTKAPDDLDVRILHAYVCLRLPETFFHRTASAVEDFCYLISRYEQDNSLFTTDFYRQLLTDLAEAYKNTNQAEQYHRIQNMLEQQKMAEFPDTHSTPAVSNINSQDDLPRKETGPVRKRFHSSRRGGLSVAEIDLYKKAFSGDLASAREAEEYFEEKMEQEPNNLELQAYHADALSLAGRYAGDTFSMFGSAIKAAKAFDSILEANPDHVEIRFMRAYHSFRLPEAFFKRTPKCIEDFKYLAESYEQNPALFPEDAYWQLLFDLGVAYERVNMGDLAQSTWQKLLSLSPSVRYVEMVDDKLADQSVGLLTELSIDDKSSYLSEAKRLHHLGAKGNRKATLLAQELWEKAAEAYSDDWTVKAYYGANLALVGRDSNDPQIMFGNGLKGLKIIKEALAQQGDNPEILRLKAMLLYSLPEAFFHFTNQSIKDFNTLIKLYKSNRNILSRQEYEEILYTLGLAYQRLGSKDQAQKVWAQLLNETSNQRYHKLINKGV